MYLKLRATLFLLCLVSLAFGQSKWNYYPLPEAAITASTLVNNRLYIGLDGKGLYFSDDYGKNWTHAQNAPGSPTSIEVTGPYVYATQSTSSGDYIFQSSDGGLSFQDYNTIPNLGPVDRVMRGDTNTYVNPTKSKIIREILILPFNYQSKDLLVLPENTIYDVEKMGDQLIAATVSGMLYSNDEGQNWETSPDVVPVSKTTRLFVKGQTLFCFDAQGHLYRSLNRGQNWSNLPWFTNHFGAFPLNSLASDGPDILAIPVDSINGHYCWKSADKGLSWTPVYDEIPTIREGFQVPGGKLIRSNQGLFFQKTAETIWHANNRNLRSNVLGSIYKSPAGRWTYAYRQGKLGLYTSTDGLDFQLIPDTRYLFGNLIGSGNQIALNACPDLLVSLDGGQSWVRRTFPENPIDVTYLAWIGNRIFYRTYEGTLRYYDPQNDIWSNISSPGTSSCAAAGDGRLFVAGSFGVRISQNGGLQWQSPAQPPPYGINWNRMFFVEGRVFLESQSAGLLFSSADYGLTWQIAGTGMDGGQVGFPETMVGQGELLFARTDPGYFFISENGGENWYQLSLPNGPYYTYNFFGAMTILEDSLVLYERSLDSLSLAKRGVKDFNLQKLFGTVYLDANQNQVQDSMELGLPNVAVYLENSERVVLSDSLGRYSIALELPSDSLKVSVANPLAKSSPAAYLVQQSATGLDFPVFLPAIDALAKLYDFGVPRSGFNTTYLPVVVNEGLDTLYQVKVRLLPDPHMVLQNTLPPATLIGDTLLWIVDTLPPSGSFEPAVTAKVSINTAAGTKLSQILWADYPGDQYPQNNRDTLMERVVTSFDPNDIAVDPPFLTQKAAAKGATLTYTIRFQNTGSYKADFIRLRDTLPAAIDLTTFRLLQSSHPVQAQFHTQRGLEFFFDGINLPPKNQNEAKSQGFVVFSFKIKPGLITGDSIENHASIYFDYNAPVPTNQAITRIVDSLVSKTQTLKNLRQNLCIFPNPAPAGNAFIQIPEGLHGNGTFSLFHSSGQLVKITTTLVNAPVCVLNFGQIPAGTYWIEFQCEGQKFWGKWVVQ